MGVESLVQPRSFGARDDGAPAAPPDQRARVMQTVTAKWIATEPALYEKLEEYWMEHLQSAGLDDELALHGRPRGFRLLYLIWRWASDIYNGGFRQFCGNALSSSDESGSLIIETLQALQQLGMDEFLAMTLESIPFVEAVDGLPPAVVAAAKGLRTGASSGISDGTAAALTRADARAALDELDQRFYASDTAWVKIFDAYVRGNPAAFLYPPSRP